MKYTRDEANGINVQLGLVMHTNKVRSSILIKCLVVSFFVGFTLELVSII